MKDDVKFFKQITDSALKDLHITEDLKKKTLNKCKSRSSHNFKPAFAAGICAALFVFTTTSYNLFLPDSISKKYSLGISTTESKLKNIGNIIKNSIINPNVAESIPKNTSKKDSKYAYKSQAETDSTKNKTTNTANKNSSDNTKVSQLANDNVSKNNTPSSEISEENNTTTEKHKISNVSQYRENTSAIEETKAQGSNKSDKNTTVITIDSAEKNFGQKVTTPSYLPDKFALKDIALPKDDKKKFIVMSYSSPDGSFTIKQDKNVNFGNNTGEKMYIGSVRAYFSQTKGSDESKLSWIKNNIQYTIQGNISKDTSIQILNSMN